MDLNTGVEVTAVKLSSKQAERRVTTPAIVALQRQQSRPHRSSRVKWRSAPPTLPRVLEAGPVPLVETLEKSGGWPRELPASNPLARLKKPLPPSPRRWYLWHKKMLGVDGKSRRRRGRPSESTRTRSRRAVAKQPEHEGTRALLAAERVVARRCPVHLGGTNLGPMREAAEGAHFRFGKGLSRLTRTTQQASTPATEHTRCTNTSQKAGPQLKATTHLFPIHRCPNSPPWALPSRS